MNSLGCHTGVFLLFCHFLPTIMFKYILSQDDFTSKKGQKRYKGETQESTYFIATKKVDF